MSTKTPKKIKYPGRGPTMRQRIAARHLVENGGSVAEAMRAAKFSEATIKSPQKLTRSKGFVKILEKAGMTDEVLAKAHNELMQSAVINHQSFPAIHSTKTIKVDENGKKLKRPQRETVYRHVPDEIIKMQIESVAGHRVLYIQKGTSEKVVYYQAPENVVRKGAIEMGYKAKGHFAPEKLEITEHELSAEEQELLEQLNG